MSSTVSHPPGPRRRGVLTAAAATVLGMLAPLAAVADDATQQFEVDGRVVYRIADPLSHTEGEHVEGEHAHEGSVTTAYAEIDGAMVDLSVVQAPTVGTAAAPEGGLPAGSEVIVTIEAPAALDENAAVALVASSDAAAAGTAQVVSAVATEVSTAPDATPRAAVVAAGVHQLVVVPVRWNASDAVPTAALQTAATGTEQYWERQSSGRIDVQTSVRTPITVPRPATCDVDQILEQTIGQAGLVPSARQHVAMWFPAHSGCGFAGLAEIDGGAIWLNGATQTYVLAHELGHNFGLGHANTLECTTPAGTRAPLSATGQCRWVEYGDNTDVMGQGRNLSSPGNISSGSAVMLGWASAHTIPRPVVTTTSIDLQPLSQLPAYRGITVQTEMGTVFVDYRPATGADALHEPGWAGVQARLIEKDPVYGHSTSYLLDLQPQRAPFTNPSLPVGQTWDVPGAGAAVTTTSTGATARLTIAPSGQSTQIQRYVTRVYADLFDRQPDPQGLATWTSGLMAGTPRVAVANAITYSDEYRSRLIAATYRTYLDRGPDPHGAATWLHSMRGGSTVQQIEVGFVASDEYYARAGGNEAAWVGRLYQHVLGRGAAPSEIQDWTSRLAAGASRSQVAWGFLVSTEHLTTVVDGYYVDLLDRHIDPTGRQTWVSAIQGGARVEAIIGGIIASDEYFSTV
jgi:hypothetical protein